MVVTTSKLEIKGSIPLLQLEGERMVESKTENKQMTPENTQKLKHHLIEAARILREETPEASLQDFESIELALREHMLNTVGPTIGDFFSQTVNRSESGNDE
jgi:hypothetical protein